MRDITHKGTSLRTATAMAFVACTKETFERIEAGNLPKGDLFNVARAAGMLGAKQTPNLIPHCHIIHIDALDIRFELLKPNEATKDTNYGVQVICEGKALDRTGLEIEVMTCASVTALTVYDLLKPIDETLSISRIELLEKQGGKSDLKKLTQRSQRCGVIHCSEGVMRGKKEDNAGELVKSQLEAHRAQVVAYKTILPEPDELRLTIGHLLEQDLAFLFTIGGTGLGAQDKTADVVNSMLERETPGITTCMYEEGVARSHQAMLSRLATGVIGNTLVITLPGSTQGAKECLDAILPGVFQARKMIMAGSKTGASNQEALI